MNSILMKLKKSLGAVSDFVRRSPLILWGGVAAAAVGFAGLAYFTGYLSGIRQLPPYGFMTKVDYKLEKALERFFPAPAVKALPPLDTAYLSLEREDIAIGDAVNWERRKGGGLTSFGADVLVLTYEGDIFAARSADTARKTGVVAPDNNRGAFREAYADLLSRENVAPRGFDYLRYNDILYFSSPDWNGLIVSYTEYHGDKECVSNSLARLEIDRDIGSIDDVATSSEDWTVFFRGTPCLPFKTKNFGVAGQMAGGHMTPAGDGSVYLTMGDLGFDGMRSDAAPMAQDPASQYGKVLEVEIADGSSEIVSSGHRNPQGIIRDPAGRLFVAEHGARGGDELNLIQRGANYGWPYESYGTTYDLTALPGSTGIGRHDRFEKPIYSWTPSPAVTALAYVDGFDPAWDGDLLLASLSAKTLIRMRLVDGRVINSEFIPFDTRLRYVHQHTDGRIALWSEEYRLIFLSPKELTNPAKILDTYRAQAGLNPAMSARLADTIASCAECHGMTPGARGTVPNLSYIYRDAIASQNGVAYSEALSNRVGVWTEESLTAFLADPQGFAPGTSMAISGIDDPALVAEVVAYLKHLDEMR